MADGLRLAVAALCADARTREEIGKAARSYHGVADTLEKRWRTAASIRVDATSRRPISASWGRRPDRFVNQIIAGPTARRLRASISSRWRPSCIVYRIDESAQG